MSDQQQFPIHGLHGIHVHLAKGDIRIERIDGEMIRVRAESTMLIEQQGDLLEIRPGHGATAPGSRHRSHARLKLEPEIGNLGAYISETVSTALSGVFGGEFGLFFGGDLYIGVPASLELPVIEVSTGHGDLAIVGVTANFRVRNESGDVKIEQAGGTLQVTNGVGDIDIDHFAGPIEARTGSGDMSLEYCLDGGVIHTGSGDVDAERISGAWQLHTGSGDLEVRVHDEASVEITTGAGSIEVAGGAIGHLSVQTGSGDVECTSLLLGPHHRIITGHGDIGLAIANPPGARLQILTRSGNVESVYPLVAVGKQGPSSHGGNGRYVGNIGESTIDIELRTASGDIEITRLDLDQALAARAVGATATQSTADTVPAKANSAESTPRAPQAPAEPVPPLPPLAAAAAIEPATGAGQSPDSTLSTGESEAPVPATDERARLRVLESLQHGDIDVNEAVLLLEALSRGA